MTIALNPLGSQNSRGGLSQILPRKGMSTWSSQTQASHAPLGPSSTVLTKFISWSPAYLKIQASTGNPKKWSILWQLSGTWSSLAKLMPWTKTLASAPCGSLQLPCNSLPPVPAPSLIQMGLRSQVETGWSQGRNEGPTYASAAAPRRAALQHESKLRLGGGCSSVFVLPLDRGSWVLGNTSDTDTYGDHLLTGSPWGGQWTPSLPPTTHTLTGFSPLPGVLLS